MEKSGLNAVIRHVRRVVLVSSSDEELLVALACRRDEDAFEVLCKRHGPMVWAVCRRVLRHTQDAEDAFQATFLVLIRKSASIRKRGSIASWLYGVAYRTARKALAVNARRRQFENLAACRPRSVVEEDHWDLDREVSALPEKYRLPVVLCELQGRTRKEVAELLKIPEGTLSSRLATARKTLARRLGDRGALLGIGAAAPAKVPAPLMMSTVQTGLSLVAGGEAAGVISGNAILLSQGVLRAMLLMKLKSVATAVVVLGSLGAGVGTYSHQVLAIGPPAAGVKQQETTNKVQQGGDKQSGDFLEVQAKNAKLAHEEAIRLRAEIKSQEDILKAMEETLEVETKRYKNTKAEVQRVKEHTDMKRKRLAELSDLKQMSANGEIKKASAEVLGAVYQNAQNKKNAELEIDAARERYLRALSVWRDANQPDGQGHLAPEATGRPRGPDLDFEATLFKLLLEEKRLSSKYGPTHPELQQVRQTISFINELIAKREAGLVNDSRDANRKALLDNAAKNNWFLVAGRRLHRIPVQFFDRVERNGARIEIQEVLGTRPKIEVGGQYVVHGKYEMPKNARGRLYFYVTSTGDWPNSGPAFDLQTMAVEKGSGEFTLMHSMGGPGQFHVQLLADDGHQETLANVYFK